MINARITSIQAHFMTYELKLIGQPDQAELKKEFKLRKSYNISGVNSVNLLRFKEFIYICTEHQI